MPLKSWVVSHTHKIYERWSLGLFVSSILLLLLTLSSLFLPVELLHPFLYTIAITTDIALLNSLVAYLLHCEGLVRHDFLHSLILSLSNSPTPDLTAMLILTCTLLVKSGTHSLYLFFQLPLTCTLLNAVYRVMSAINDPISIVPQLRWIYCRPLAFAHRRR